MQAGDLRARVGFYQREVQSDGYGNNQASYAGTPEFIVAANIKPRLGGEQVLAGRLIGQNLVNITVRQSSNTSSVTVDWRVKNELTGELYNIHSIIDPEQETPRHGRHWEMLCEKGVAT